MIQIGTRVKVKDNYSGGLGNVAGRLGKVVTVKVTPPEMHNQYELDIKGSKKVTYQGYHGPTEYTQEYPVIVDGSEIEDAPYGFKDKEGNFLELGDIIVYGVHGGGLIKGTVVDFKDTVYPQWGDEYPCLKFKVEYGHRYELTDGLNRSVEKEYKATQWLSNSDQTLIIQKNPVKNFFFNNDMTMTFGDE